jgi:hypothetical protein
VRGLGAGFETGAGVDCGWVVTGAGSGLGEDEPGSGSGPTSATAGIAARAKAAVTKTAMQLERPITARAWRASGCPGREGSGSIGSEWGTGSPYGVTFTKLTAVPPFGHFCSRQLAKLALASAAR